MNWQRQFTREYSLLRWEEYLKSTDYLSFFEISGVKKVNFIVDGFSLPQTNYYLLNEWQKKIEQPLLKYCLTISGGKKLLNNYWQTVKTLNQFLERLKKLNLKNLSNQQFLKLIIDVRKNLIPYFSIGVWGIWILEPILGDKKFISQNLGLSGKKDISTLLTPPKLAAHFQEELALRKLNIKNEKSVKNHLKKFQWIPVVDFFEKPWQEKDLIRRQRALIGGKPTIDFKQRRDLLKRYRLLINKLDFLKRQLAEIIHQITFIKDHRNDIRFYANFFIRDIYKEISKRFNLTIKEISFLTDEEIINLLKSPKIVSKIKEKVKERQKGYLIRKYSNKVIVLTGEQANILRKKLLQGENKNREIRGITASSGKARGVAVIVKNDNDLRKVKKGSIMVAIFTRPHYLLAMRKAKGIVTEEGGLTCHAAIVSRELKIPCVVGTKIATQVLKDGDLVEVDATKGIVRKIKLIKSKDTS